MVPDRDHWYHDLMALPIADPHALHGSDGC